MGADRLTRCELELMDVLWRHGEATVQQVCQQLSRPLAYTTVMTTLNVLACKKGVLRRVKRGRAYVYQPLVSRQQVCRSVLEDLRQVLFGNALPSLVLTMLSEEEMSADDIAALKAALEKVEKRG